MTMKHLQQLIVLPIHTGNRDPVCIIRVSHISVFDVFPVHQHVLSAQRPHLALTGHHMVLKYLLAVFAHLWR